MTYYEERVEGFMTRNPVRIDMNRTVADAIELMASAGIRKILLLKDGAPAGILPLDWARSLNKDAPIFKALAQVDFKLQRPALVRREATFAQVKDRLLESPAVLVVDNIERPSLIEGIVTATDMIKARPRI